MASLSELAEMLAKRIKDLTRTATSSDLTDGEFVAVDKTGGYTRKMTVANLATWVLGKIKNLPTTITSFRSGDNIVVDGPGGPAHMGKDSLLLETAQKALAGNVAPTFDPNKPNDSTTGYAYLEGESVYYLGKLYMFKVNHLSGPWDSNEVIQSNGYLASVSKMLGALPFLNSKKYLPGEYCIHNGVVVRFNSPHTGGWQPAHATLDLRYNELLHKNLYVEIGGIEYRCIVVGKYIWLAENLRNPIGVLGTDYFYPWNNKEFSESYGMGLLYRVSSVVPNGEMVEELTNMLPQGWSVPTDGDVVRCFIGSGRVVKTTMMLAPSSLWQNVFTNDKPDDIFGFSALPCGNYGSGGSIPPAYTTMRVMERTVAGTNLFRVLLLGPEDVYLTGHTTWASHTASCRLCLKLNDDGSLPSDCGVYTKNMPALPAPKSGKKQSLVSYGGPATWEESASDNLTDEEISRATGINVQVIAVGEKPGYMTPAQIVQYGGGGSSAEVASERAAREAADSVLQAQIDSINPQIIEGGTITNAPDNQDLAVTVDNKLKFKDRLSVDTRGYVFLRSNISFASQLQNANTIYEIRYMYDLGGATVNIPSGCQLKFNGGCIKNGTLHGNFTEIASVGGVIFENTIDFSGTWNVPKIYSGMFRTPTSEGMLQRLAKLQSDSVYNEFLVENSETEYIVSNMKDNVISLSLTSNTRFVNLGTIKMKPNGYPRYGVIGTNHKSNVDISGGKISGECREHDYTSGGSHEWGHCINIMWSKDVFIHDIEVVDATGDGVYVIGDNICIKNIIGSHCGRQGISLIDVNNVSVENFIFDDIYRTAPRAAIDVEPIPGRSRNVTIRNGIVSNCMGLWFVRTDNLSVENVKATDCDQFIRLDDCSHAKFVNMEYNAELARNNIVIFNYGSNEVSIDGIAFNFEDGTTPSVYEKRNGPYNINVQGSSIPFEGQMKYNPSSAKMTMYNGTAWVDL